ncbi:pro-neuregulin-1, membrane-bound isoform isoform X1 [Stegostoma tigrinum]|uniref:pro-neuregulin-1, membrane-bound isoform isoform X1 n=2 Tax=Stegostoma tigrinum TaxID=3053191 RepID=UPI00202B9757|nr:pro-neuregulin-1, membrane-bound isoform isoform X1 [Stegostoma tigrinum]
MSEEGSENSPDRYPPPCLTPSTEDTAEDAPSAGQNGALGLSGLIATCCICMEVEHVRTCLNSEKICIIPIMACLVSLGLCIAGLKWVFVDKIFEYEPLTHLDPKRIGQGPIISADQATVAEWPPPSTAFTATFPISDLIQTVNDPDDPLVLPSTPYASPSPQPPTSSPSFLPSVVLESFSPDPVVTKNREVTESAFVTLPQMTDTNLIIAPAFTTTSPTPWSGHARPCNDSDRHYCVNGGQCFVINGINKLSCQCPNEFTGDRCQNYVMASFYKHLGIEFMEAEELYQKRVLTITGICIALLVVGIMCVVAYCKTKKQRKKLHDRLRQSLRTERNNMVNLVNGPHHTNPPAENVQLANQYIMKNPGSTEHVIERETETSFSTSHYTSTTHHSTTVTHTPSHSWSTGQIESVISDSPSVLVTSSIETSRHTSPINHRGRLNGVAGRREMLICVRNSRDTPDSLRDSPHSERFVSAMTTPARMSPVDFRTPVSQKSPNCELSPPVSSLTISMPSVTISPLIEEERPLLLVIPPRQREKRQDPYKQYHNSAQDSGSIPASPLRVVEDDEYETTQEYEPTLESPKKGAGNRRGKRTKANGHISQRMETESNPISESSSSDSETEDERIGEETPFLSIQNPMLTSVDSAPAYRLAESRTNSTNRYSTQEELQVRLSNVIANQDPIAV